MENIQCKKHQLNKNFILCLEDGCHQRLVCRKCCLMDEKHIVHKRVYIDDLLNSDQDELERVFSRCYAQTVKDNQNVKTFVQILDARFEKIMDESEEMIRKPFETMFNNYRLLFQQSKKELYQRFKLDSLKTVEQIQQSVRQLIESDSSQQKQKETKQLIDDSNGIIKIEEKLDQMFKQIQQNNQYMVDEMQSIFSRYRMNYVSISRSQADILQYAKQQYQNSNQICVNYDSQIENYKNIIKQYQQEDKQFKIYVDFKNHDTSLDSKTSIVDMVDQLNINHKVSMVGIRVSNNNPLDNELLTKIFDRYDKAHAIVIDDYSNQVDIHVHDQLKLLTEGLTVLQFQLRLYGNLKSSKDGVDLLKEYNEIMKRKEHLCNLYYHHDKINKHSEQKEQIEQMIKTVSNM